MALTPAREIAAPLVQPRARGGGRRRGSSWWLYLLLGFGLLLMVGPFVWMLLGSVKTQAELLRIPPTWLPEQVTLANYDQLFNRLDFPLYFRNSAIVAGAVTVGNVIFCSMVGYALAKLRFHGKHLLFLLVIGTLFVPSAVLVIPLYILLSLMGLINTLQGLILPFLAGSFGVFLMRQFMLGIPDELLEAGRIDGASEWRLFWQVVMPLSTPALATLGILTFLGSWNAFFWPLIAATEEKTFTLPVALATFATGQHQANQGLLMAGSVVIVLPILIVFILLQRYFTESIASVGIKG
jgi:multiple sugar transport system permease protein